MNTAWPPTPLSRALRRVEDVVHLEDRKQYKQVTVSLHGRGLRLRQVVKGADVKTKRQFRVRAGQFVYSRIDARNGAFGLVPPELDGAVVSNDFPVFDVEENVAEPKFIAYLTQSRWFVAQCEDPSRGVTNRQRMAEELLLALEVPMPPLVEQRRIIHAIDAVATRLAEAQHLREAIEDEREEMLRAFARELAKDAPRHPLQKVAPITRRPVTIDKAATYRELGVRSFGRGLFEKPTIKGADLTWERPYWMRAGDLLFSNIKAWEGAVAVITEEYDGFVGSHRYITCRPDTAQVTPEFLCQWLLTEEGLKHLGGSSPGATDRNRTLGLKKLQGIPVPVPPLGEQQRLSRLSWQVSAMKQTQAIVAEDLDAMMPAALDLAFRGEL